MLRALLVVALGAASVTASGCGDGYLYRNDHRVTIESPGSFASVAQRFTVRWTARDFQAPRDGRYAVLFDLAPPGPGDTLGDIPPVERPFVKVVDDTQVQAPFFVPDSNATGPLQDHHEVTVILLDPQGRRISETAGFVEFDVNTT